MVKLRFKCSLHSENWGEGDDLLGFIFECKALSTLCRFLSFAFLHIIASCNENLEWLLWLQNTTQLAI